MSASVRDVLDCFQHNCDDQFGMSMLDWKLRICEGDAFYNIMKILARDRDNPAYSKLIYEIEAEVEGWS
jgi:hypothetical protein